MGNCVTVSVIKRIAQQIKKALDAKNNTAQKDIAIRRSQQMVFAKYEKDIIRNLQ
jgi:microcompartment protein CcmL/EutN